MCNMYTTNITITLITIRILVEKSLPAGRVRSGAALRLLGPWPVVFSSLPLFVLLFISILQKGAACVATASNRASEGVHRLTAVQLRALGMVVLRQIVCSRQRHGTLQRMSSSSAASSRERRRRAQQRHLRGLHLRGIHGFLVSSAAPSLTGLVLGCGMVVLRVCIQTVLGRLDGGQDQRGHEVLVSRGVLDCPACMSYR